MLSLTRRVVRSKPKIVGYDWTSTSGLWGMYQFRKVINPTLPGCPPGCG